MAFLASSNPTATDRRTPGPSFLLGHFFFISRSKKQVQVRAGTRLPELQTSRPRYVVLAVGRYFVLLIPPMYHLIFLQHPKCHPSLSLLSVFVFVDRHSNRITTSASSDPPSSRNTHSIQYHARFFHTVVAHRSSAIRRPSSCLILCPTLLRCAGLSLSDFAVSRT